MSIKQNFERTYPFLYIKKGEEFSIKQNSNTEVAHIKTWESFALC